MQKITIQNPPWFFQAHRQRQRRPRQRRNRRLQGFRQAPQALPMSIFLRLCKLLCLKNTPAGYYPDRGVLFEKRNEARYRLRLIPFSVIQTLCSLQRAWKGLPSSHKHMRVRQPRKQEYSWCRIQQQDSWRGGIPARPSMMKSSALMRYMHFHSSMNRRQRDENYPS